MVVCLSFVFSRLAHPRPLLSKEQRARGQKAACSPWRCVAASRKAGDGDGVRNGDADNNKGQRPVRTAASKGSQLRGSQGSGPHRRAAGYYGTEAIEKRATEEERTETEGERERRRSSSTQSEDQGPSSASLLTTGPRKLDTPPALCSVLQDTAAPL